MYYDKACINSPKILFLIDPISGKIIEANKKAETTYGYSVEQLCNMKFSDINVLNIDEITNGINKTTFKLKNFFHFPHITASGNIINMDVEIYPTKIDNKDYLFSVVYPSDKKNVFVNASISLLEKSSDALVVIDQFDRVIKINKSFEKLFNVNEDDINGESGNKLLEDLSIPRYEYLLKKLSSGKTETIAFKKTEDNNFYEYTVSGIPTFYSENYLGSVISIRRTLIQNFVDGKINEDIGKKLLEMERSNSEKNDFLARMSHDMRTPMNAIIGMANFGIDEIKDKKAHNYFSQIKDSSEYLLALINDILDMQKLESGEIKLEEVITNTPRIAQKVRTIIEPRAEQKGIKLIFDLECDEMYRFVKIDERRIEQVIINILNNAIKYTPEGGTVTWRDYAEKLNDGRIKVSHEFIDTGVGISEGFQTKMFEPFTSELNSQSKSEGGSGLGLAITKNLIETMGGTITCKSKLGKGTTFFMEIILTPATDDEITLFLKKSNSNTGLNSLKGKKILICEDVEVNIIILKKLLSVYQCEIDISRNGLEALIAARNNKYDAILMDIRMPIMNGLEAAREIRKFDKKVPILALSANAYSEDIKKSKEAGMNAHLAKPIIREELYSNLIAIID